MGGVVGGVIVAVLVIGGAVFLCLRRKRKAGGVEPALKAGDAADFEKGEPALKAGGDIQTGAAYTGAGTAVPIGKLGPAPNIQAKDAPFPGAAAPTP